VGPRDSEHDDVTKVAGEDVGEGHSPCLYHRARPGRESAPEYDLAALGRWRLRLFHQLRRDGEASVLITRSSLRYMISTYLRLSLGSAFSDFIWSTHSTQS
jgi:hypothetical protein